MSKYSVGDNIRFRTLSHQIVGGEILKVKKGWFGVKYLVEYGVHDLDFGGHWITNKWIAERRLL